MNKKTLIGTIAFFGLILIALFNYGFYNSEKTSSLNPPKQHQQSTEQPTLISTSPNPLNEAILIPGQSIILTFSHPLENLPELKYKFEPEIEGLQGQLSQDKKTVTFKSPKPLPVGQSYTLTIQQEAKFEGGKHLDKQYEFRFKTIDYKGV